MSIVLDASVTLSWCFPDEQSLLSMKVLDSLKAGEQALVPAFWSAEILNALLVAEKRGRISPAQTKAFLLDLLKLNPILENASFEEICGPVQACCREHGLTPYDALYIVLARRVGCALATLDRSQQLAAKTLGVECL